MCLALIFADNTFDTLWNIYEVFLIFWEVYLSVLYKCTALHATQLYSSASGTFVFKIFMKHRSNFFLIF